MQLAGVNDIVVVVVRNDNKNSDNDIINIIDKLSIKKRLQLEEVVIEDITLDNNTVSRYHAVIENPSNDYYIIRDLDSRNGIYVNGKKVRDSRRIKITDKIFIGRHQLSLAGEKKDLRDELAIKLFD